MKNHCYLLAVLVVLLSASSALALDGMASVSVDGGQHVVTVRGCFWIEGPEGVAGIVLKCEPIGLCDEGFFYPEEPVPLEFVTHDGDCEGYQVTIQVDPPHADVGYLYTPYWADEEGNLTATQHSCDADGRTFALAGTDTAPLYRGILQIATANASGYLFRFDACADGCWPDLYLLEARQDELESMTGLLWSELVGKAVDVYGDRTYCTMPGGPYYEITNMALAPDGLCGPVPVSQTSWDGLKAMYR